MARKRLRTIGSRIVRELERKLPENLQKQHETEFSNFKKALTQERNSKDKVYSLHEPQTACIAKGRRTRFMNLAQKGVL
jgi:IS5 family transposase